MTSGFKGVLAILLLVPAVLLAAGCREEEPPAATPAVTMEDQWTVKGKVVSVAEKGVTIDHQDIPGLMAAMTMTFAVKDPAVLQGLEAADAIEFTLVRSTDGLQITRIRKINAAELEAGKKPQT